jgi:hypothetical protein
VVGNLYKTKTSDNLSQGVKGYKELKAAILVLSMERLIVSKRSAMIRGITILGLCLIGCARTNGRSAEDSFPAVSAVCFCETDPNVTMPLGYIGKVQPVPAKQILVIPVYKNYSQDGTLYLSITHPFVYKQGDDIEKPLTAFGRREHLQKIVFWIPGYFPVSIPRSFRQSGDMDGKRVVVGQVQKCIGQEDGQLNSAMKALLEKASFPIQERAKYNYPAYSDKPILSKEPYDFSRLVQSEEYHSRYFKYGNVFMHYGLWGAKTGMMITNQFSADEKNIVAAFFSETTKKVAKPPLKNEKAGD